MEYISHAEAECAVLKSYVKRTCTVLAEGTGRASRWKQDIIQCREEENGLQEEWTRHVSQDRIPSPQRKAPVLVEEETLDFGDPLPDVALPEAEQEQRTDAEGQQAGEKKQVEVIEASEDDGNDKQKNLQTLIGL